MTIHFIGGDKKVAAVDLSKLVSVGPVKPYNRVWNTRFTFFPEGVPEGIVIEAGNCGQNIDISAEHASLVEAWANYRERPTSSQG